MASYESVIGTLEAELATVADVFAGLTPEQWRRSTLLVPVDPDLPKWTVFELARQTTGRRPAGLSDDRDWILAASGRAPSDDNRLPLIG